MYSYANGNPVNLADPDGQKARAIIAATIAAASKAKKFVDDLNFDGPSAGLKYGNGRICQIRYKKQPVIRLDYHPYTGTNNESRLHLNIGTGEDNHISLDPRSLRD